MALDVLENLLRPSNPLANVAVGSVGRLAHAGEHFLVGVGHGELVGRAILWRSVVLRPGGRSGSKGEAVEGEGRSRVVHPGAEGASAGRRARHVLLLAGRCPGGVGRLGRGLRLLVLLRRRLVVILRGHGRHGSERARREVRLLLLGLRRGVALGARGSRAKLRLHGRSAATRRASVRPAVPLLLAGRWRGWRRAELLLGDTVGVHGRAGTGVLAGSDRGGHGRGGLASDPTFSLVGEPARRDRGGGRVRAGSEEWRRESEGGTDRVGCTTTCSQAQLRDLRSSQTTQTRTLHYNLTKLRENDGRRSRREGESGWARSINDAHEAGLVDCREKDGKDASPGEWALRRAERAKAKITKTWSRGRCKRSGSGPTTDVPERREYAP